MLRNVRLLLLTGLMALAPIANATALPKNFRNVDTFYVGAMPEVEDMNEFYQLGIRTIISLHELPPEVQKAAKKQGITTYEFPLRTRLQHIDEIMKIMREAPVQTVYLHCLHGADRTGAVTAYWLTSERNMEPFQALLSVVSPSKYHVNGLVQLGQEYGLCLYLDDDWIGRYSGAKNGGLEGLKICGNAWYTKLARNFLSMTLGPPVNHKNEKFWNKYNKNEKDVKPNK